MTLPERGAAQSLAAVLPTVAAHLPTFLPEQRWFGGKERTISRVAIRDTAVVPDHPGTLLAVVDVFTDDDPPASYFLPLGFSQVAAGEAPGALVTRHGDLDVRDAIANPDTCRALLGGIAEGRSLPTEQGGRFVFQPVKRLQGGDPLPLSSAEISGLTVRHANVEQSNSSVIFGTALILKALRRMAVGVNPEIEIARFLGEHTTFDRVPALVGWAEYVAPDGSSAPVAVLQRFVANQGDGWAYVLAKLAQAGDQRALVSELAALGQTLGGLHLGLATVTDDPDFAPEPVAAADLEVWRSRTHASLDEALVRIGRGLAGTAWSPEDRALGETVQAHPELLRTTIDGIGGLADGRTVWTRHHGDFHLGQTLVAPDGWIIIDFEGEPLRSLAERRAKQTPLRDVAGLLRSLEYARATVTRSTAADGQQGANGGSSGTGDIFDAMRVGFLAAYVATVRAGGAPLLPATEEQLSAALQALELEKALYELEYELGNRPDWVGIPLSALARLAQSA